MPASKLTDTQLVILSTASKAEAPLGTEAFADLKAKGAALTAVINRLIERGLLKETRVKVSEPVWRKDETGRAKALVITADGLAALGVEDGASEAETPQSESGHDAGAARNDPDDLPTPRSGTKQARLVELLNGAHGASITDLTEALGWLPHTVRAALTGLRKRGYEIERRVEDGTSRYSITAGSRAA
jgi:DNA-binding MarR family transcriptional regulator